MSPDGYGSRPTDFMVGERVQIHPDTDQWIPGAQYGTVVKVGRDWVHVRLDGTDSAIMFRPRRIRSAVRV